MAYKFDTLAVHAGQPNDEQTGAVAVPIYQTSTYGQIEPGIAKGYIYSRGGNPTRRALEECLGTLEGGKHGSAYASGLAAANTCLNLLKSGDHVISCLDLYGGSYRIFTKLYQKFGVDFTLTDTTVLSNIQEAIRPNTAMLWLETPSNPLLKITDLAGAAAIAKKHGIIVVADNTFASPYLQNPLKLGVDIVLHSTTKYLSGHSDTIGGGLVTDRDDLGEQLRFFQNAVGGVPGPMDCFLTIRGIKTLGIRMERHCANALAVAKFLNSHPKVERVFYPGLEADPGHKTAKRQMRLLGGMVSCVLKAGLDQTRRFAMSTELFTLAESLGSTKSLLCHPPTMTHASIEPDVRRAHGIPDGLIRLSIGIEDPSDLIEDLDNALKTVT